MYGTDKIRPLDNWTIGNWKNFTKERKKFINPFQPGMYFLCCHIYIIYIRLIISILLGKILMCKLRDQAKHFFSTHKNDVNYDSFHREY